MAENIIEIDDDSFEKLVLQSDKPIMVDFWAPWCGPCKAIAPTVEALEKEFGDQMTFAKVNVDDNKTLASKYGIMNIPTMILFKNGEKLHQFMGVQSKENIINKVKRFVA